GGAALSAPPWRRPRRCRGGRPGPDGSRPVPHAGSVTVADLRTTHLIVSPRTGVVGGLLELAGHAGSAFSVTAGSAALRILGGSSAIGRAPRSESRRGRTEACPRDRVESVRGDPVVFDAQPSARSSIG